jgi:long-chain acyl-CoA synthetase
MQAIVSPPLASTLARKNLVITGVTGFVGKVWLAQLLAHMPDLGRITVLVRGQRTRSAQQRIAEIADTSPAFRPVKAAAEGHYGAWLSRRLEVVESDLTKPRCGLDDATFDRLAAQTDCVIHIAGLTDFQPDPKKGFPANVDGTLHVAELVAATASQRLVHMSTCFVAGFDEGRTPEQLDAGVSPNGTHFDPDVELAEIHTILGKPIGPTERIDAVVARAHALGWPNLYTFSKGLAEHFLALRSDIDLTIVRPSVVECARTFPLPGWNEGLNTSAPIMWFCGTPFRRFPATPEHHFDIVPVDAVCRWLTIVTAAHLRGTARPVYQFASSDINPTTFGRIFELTALAHRRDARKGSATLTDRLKAQLDIAPRRLDDQGMLQPHRISGLLQRVRDGLGTAQKDEGLQGRLLRGLGLPISSLRRDLRTQQRKLGSIERMFEAYQPFVHDHDWVFCSDHIRDELDRLHPDDHALFKDDVTDLCWRSYWLDVQFPGVKRWSFPIMEGKTVPLDPPSSPPLRLSDTPDEAPAGTLQGAA